MHRREAVQSVALLLGGSIIGGNLFLTSGCKPSTTEIEQLFQTDMQELLAEIAETILPATTTPGAKEAGVGGFIPVMVRDCYTEREQKIFLSGLQKLDKISKDLFGHTFSRIPAQQKTSLFIQLDKEQKAYTQKKKHDDPPHFFRMLKELTLLGYFTSEVGATKGLKYVAVPGRYDACIDYKKGDRAFNG
jgi:hypothetical protein